MNIFKVSIHIFRKEQNPDRKIINKTNISQYFINNNKYNYLIYA